MDAGSLAGVAILIGVLAYPTLVGLGTAWRRWKQNRRARRVIGY